MARPQAVAPTARATRTCSASCFTSAAARLARPPPPACAPRSPAAAQLDVVARGQPQPTDRGSTGQTRSNYKDLPGEPAEHALGSRVRSFDASRAVLRLRRSASSVYSHSTPFARHFSDRSHTTAGSVSDLKPALWGAYEKVCFNSRLPRCLDDARGLPGGNTGPCTVANSYTGFLCDCQSGIRCIHTNAAVEAEFTIKCVDSERYLRSGIPRWGAGRPMQGN